MLYDGHSAEAVEVMKGIPCLTLMHLHLPWVSDQEQAAWAAYDARHTQWRGQAGNFLLMQKQGEQPVAPAELLDAWLQRQQGACLLE